MSHKGVWRRQLSTPPTRLQHIKAACVAFLTGLLESLDFQSCSRSKHTHLWSNVVGCAAEGGRGDPVTDPLLAHSKVCQFTVTLVVQKYVVQFQISARNKKQQVVGQPGPTPSTWLSWVTGWEITQLGELSAHALQREHTSLCYLENKFGSALDICLMVPRRWFHLNGLTTYQNTGCPLETENVTSRLPTYLKPMRHPPTRPLFSGFYLCPLDFTRWTFRSKWPLCGTDCDRHEEYRRSFFLRNSQYNGETNIC